MPKPVRLQLSRRKGFNLQRLSMKAEMPGGCEDEDPPMICPMTGTYCIRAFCEDYGCATKAGVPLDEYDFERGSLDPDEMMPAIPKRPR